MATPVPLGPEQRISDPKPPWSRVFARDLASIAPAQIAAFSDGDFVVVYEDFYPNGYGHVYARIITPAGTMSPEIPFPLNGSGNDLLHVSVAVAPGSSDFVVLTYENYPGRPIKAVIAFLVTKQSAADGSIALGWKSTIGVTQDSLGLLNERKWAPTIALAPGSRDYLVAWMRSVNFGFGPLRTRRSDIGHCVLEPKQGVTTQVSVTHNVKRARTASTSNARFNACMQLAPLTTGLLVMVYQHDDGSIEAAATDKDGGDAASAIVGFGNYPSVAVIGNGRFVVVYYTDHTVVYKIFTLGAERGYWELSVVKWFGANRHATGRTRPAVAALSNGNFVIAWEGSGSLTINARVFDTLGLPVTDEFELYSGSLAAAPVVVGNPNGGFYAAYMFLDGSEWGIKGQAWTVV
jgi:hypothetical protein